MTGLEAGLGREKRVRDIAGTGLVRQSCRAGLSSFRRVRGLSLAAVSAAMAALLVVGLVAVALIADPPKVTSVVLVVLDTVRADHCSAYGYGNPTTPRLDRLASEGLLFEHARSVAPWTLPSHASLFTGLLPHQHGCDWEHRWLADSQVTLAEKLATAGFDSLGVTTNPNASSLYHLDQGFHEFRETWRLREKHRGLSDSAIAVAEVRAWLERHDPARPFFLFVNLADAHLPYAPPPPLDRLFGEPDERARHLASRGDLLQATLVGEEQVKPEDRPGLAALYDGELRTADTRLGELLDLLDELRLAGDAIVIVTSDHGEHLGEEGRVDHQLSLDETLLRVPLVVRCPRYVKPGRVREPVALTDVARWIDDVVDRRLPEWSPPPDRAPEAFVAEALRPVDLVDFVASRGGDASAIDKRLAAAWRPDAGGAFKLLVTEPGEASLWRIDAAGREQPAPNAPSEVAQTLRKLLAEELRFDSFVETESDLAPAPRRDPRELEELRRLGYVGAPAPGDVGVHAAEHWAAGLRAKQRGELDAARIELRRAAGLAPAERGIQQLLLELGNAPPR
jgi:arylsulfatase A-like enzyme